MTKQHAECDFERLRLLLLHELPMELEEETANHVAECADCRRKLESLAGDQDWWTRVKSCFRSNAGLLKGTRSPDASHAPVPSERLGGSNALATDFAVEFLEPCERPETLGRLDDIEILEVIGSGGMGIILKGYQRELGRYVAVKVMAPHLAISGTARNRFAREARAAAAVVHPHVMAIHSVNGARQLPYFVMPYVLGESLQQRIDRQGQLATFEIVRIAMQTADGLAAAHAQGLIHRDVKPANILLEKGVERVLITDFGLARAADDASLTRSGVIAGTPQYMAPEQAEGATLDHRTDLFSLGSTLYAMCTGRPPFRAETAVAVLRRICDDKPRTIREVNAEIPLWLEEIVKRLHQKDPRDRFQTAAEVSELLGRHLAHLQQPTTQPKPLPLAEEVRTAPRKKRPSWRRLLTVAATLLCAVVAWAGITYWGGLFPAAPFHNPLPGPLVLPKIDRRPQPAIEDDEPKEMIQVPEYDPDSDVPRQMDLRGRDLSKLDLRNSADDLQFAFFDDRTVWPASDRLPSDFDPQEIMDLGKNPGLGVRSLHEKGITGRGVRIAIIDSPLFVDHQEYADRLQLYEEIHIQIGMKSHTHGSGVASLAVGKTVGVAPEAELFYIAQWDSDWEKGDLPTLRYRAQGIHRILEINEQLPQDKKIRVISISKGWTRGDLSSEEYEIITEAVQKARAAGMLVVCTSVEFVHEGCDYAGLGRSPWADPDVFESYEPSQLYAEGFWAGHHGPSDRTFWVPMDSRTKASGKGVDEYVFHRRGGGSWSVPYIAGVYALAVQVDPEITPEQFWALASWTGRTIELEQEGKRLPLGAIIDPVELIRSLTERKER